MEQFEIAGCKFWFKRLGFEDGCRGVRLVAEVMGPALSARGDVAAALTASVDRLPQLVKLFAPYTQVQADDTGAGRKVPLDKFVDDCFRGRLDRAVLYVAHCAVLEFGDYFLVERAESIGTQFSALLERFPSLQALLKPSSSGDASSADTSKAD